MVYQWWSIAVQIFASFIAVYMIIIILFYTVILFISMLQLRKEYKLNREDTFDDVSNEWYTKPVSIIVPAYNEEAGIIPSVRSLLSINYPQFEICCQ